MFVGRDYGEDKRKYESRAYNAKWGNTAQYEAFINHWTACKVCKPNLNRYCDEGQQLKSEADKSYFAF